MDRLIVVGVSHRTAPIALRERLAVVADGLDASVRALGALTSVREALLLSTCNRVEVYAAADDPEAVRVAVGGHLARRASLRQHELEPHIYDRRGRAAVHHLFRVCASLDSLVVGEPQVLGQVKEAFDAATRCGTAGPLLGQCFPRAFRVARRVRRDTAIARAPVSVSSVAVELARQVFDGFAGRSVLVVGAGKMAAAAARSFADHGASVVVTNRTSARAEELAARLGCRTHAFSDLAKALQLADIVLASTGARDPVITRALLGGAQRTRRGRPLFLLDIAVPRDVEPSCADLDGVYLADMDNLQTVAASHLEGRRGEADLAEALVEQELSRFVVDYGGRTVAPTIGALRGLFLGAARAEADKLAASLAARPAGLGDSDRRAILEAFEATAKKLLHAPQLALRRRVSADGAGLAEAVRLLFDLPPLAEVEPPPTGDDPAIPASDEERHVVAGPDPDPPGPPDASDEGKAAR